MNADSDAEVEHAQGRIDVLLASLRAEAPAETVERVEELVEHVVNLYGSALARVTEALADDTSGAGAVRDRLASDPLVSTLLVVHGLHPLDLRARVERALAEVTPYVTSHGGKVSLVDIANDVVTLALRGACESCSSSAATAADLLERTVKRSAPEIARVVVDAGKAAKTHAGGELVQLGVKKKQETPPAPEPRISSPAHEACEMCGSPLGDAHDHVARLDARELLCVCRACRLLFAHEGATRGRYRPVAERWLAGETYALTDLEWARLGIPVRMAFFVVESGRGGPVGFYPSPGGVVEATVDDDAWSGIARAAAIFAALEPDVEAWLVDGRRRDGFDGWVVPLDACYELVARVRMHWSGFDGGDVARSKIEEFFTTVRGRASSPHTHAGAGR
jgi:Fe-S cluster biogenesis protein NfuA